MTSCIVILTSSDLYSFFLAKFTASLYKLCPRCPPFRFSLPSPHPKEADTDTNCDFFNSSLVRTCEDSAVHKHLKKLCHGCLVHFVNNGSCAPLLAM